MIMKRGSARNPRPKACLSFRACRGIPWKGTILKPDRGRSKAFPFPHGVSPVSVPLIAMQQGIHGKPRWAGTLSVSQSGAFSDCVTRFRGGALRHAKFPKTSYKVQLLDTLKHAACVSLNHGRRRDLIFLSSKVLVPSWAKRKRFVGLPLISASGASPRGEAKTVAGAARH